MVVDGKFHGQSASDRIVEEYIAAGGDVWRTGAPLGSLRDDSSANDPVIAERKFDNNRLLSFQVTRASVACGSGRLSGMISVWEVAVVVVGSILNIPRERSIAGESIHTERGDSMSSWDRVIRNVSDGVLLGLDIKPGNLLRSQVGCDLRSLIWIGN